MDEEMVGKKRGKAAIILALMGKGKGGNSEDSDEDESLNKDGKKAMAQSVIDAVKASDAEALAESLTDFVNAC
jgi:hypothetical protein